MRVRWWGSSLNLDGRAVWLHVPRPPQPYPVCHQKDHWSRRRPHRGWAVNSKPERAGWFPGTSEGLLSRDWPPASPTDRGHLTSSNRGPSGLNKWEWPSGKLRSLRFVKTVFSQVWIICTEASLCLGTVFSLSAQMVYFQPCSLGTLPPFPKPYSSAVSQSLLGLNSLPFHCPSLIRKSVGCGLG